MTIGIHALAAFVKERTGVEEYCYQLIRHLMMLPESREHRYVLYTKPTAKTGNPFELMPENFEIRELASPYLWTQIRLSIEMTRNSPDVLFIPSHVLPLVHPSRSVVHIHGLEFEHVPECYPLVHRAHLRYGTRRSARRAARIIVSTETTKRELVQRYASNPETITVIPFGAPQVPRNMMESEIEIPYILYIGRIETRKNVHRIVEAFAIAKERTQLPHCLVLAGKKGFGAEEVLKRINASSVKNEIEVLGYVNEHRKWSLLQHATLFLFPTLFEGFGMPVLEAQAVGTPVVTSKGCALEEVSGGGAILTDPINPYEIARAVTEGIRNVSLRQTCIEKGRENVKKYSWAETARMTLQLLSHTETLQSI